MPIYLHPNTPPAFMIGPILDNMSIAREHKRKFYQTNAERIFSL